MMFALNGEREYSLEYNYRKFGYSSMPESEKKRIKKEDERRGYKYIPPTGFLGCN